MVALTRLRGNRQATSILPFTVFLLWSHGVCNACNSSPPRKTPTNGDPSSKGEQSGDPYVEGSSNGKEDSYFTRDTRNENAGMKEEVFHHCQKRLTDELNKICDGQFHDPNPEYRGRSRSLTQTLEVPGRRSHVKRGNGQVVVIRRVPRSLVDECCTKSCTTNHVQRYCKQGTGTSNESTTEVVTTMKPSEETTTPNQGTGWEQSTEPENLEPHRKVSVKNVVTSTLPPQLVSLSRGTDDYIYQQ